MKFKKGDKVIIYNLQDWDYENDGDPKHLIGIITNISTEVDRRFQYTVSYTPRAGGDKYTTAFLAIELVLDTPTSRLLYRDSDV